MRRFLHSCKEIGTVLAAGAALFFFAFLYASPVFPRGEEYTVYRGSSSSPMVQTDTPALTKMLLGGTTGESTVYEGDCFEALKTHFHATLLWTEEVAGVVNYYLYSPDLSGGVSLRGTCVNLHVAVREGCTAVGTPLIFGGY